MDLGGFAQAGKGQSPNSNLGGEGGDGDPFADANFGKVIDDYLANLPTYQFINQFTGTDFNFNGQNAGYVDPNSLNIDPGDIVKNPDGDVKKAFDRVPAADNSITGRIEAKFNELKDTISDPKKLFNTVIDQVTGYDIDKGTWSPGKALGTVGAVGSGGILSVLGLIDSAANFFGVDTPKINVKDFFGGASDDASHSLPDAINQLAHQNNNDLNNIVPVYGDDGSLSGVGYLNGNDMHVVTPDELSNAGLTPSDLTKLDWGSDNSITVTKPPVGSQPPVFDSPQGPPAAVPTDPGGGGTPAAPKPKPTDPTLPKPGDENTPSPGGSGGGDGTPTTGGAPGTPVAGPTGTPFQFFEMPGFKLLPNDFGADGPELKPASQEDFTK